MTKNILPQERISSVDALRGFTMLWLTALTEVIRHFPDISGKKIISDLAAQFEHVPWNGIHIYDLIFPTFTFIIGVTLPYSYTRRLQKESKTELYKHVFSRSLVLFALGIITFGYNDPGLEAWGFYSVLPFLAFAYLFSSLIMLNTSVRGVCYWFAGIFLFYLLIMKLYPVPGFGSGVFERGKNFNDYIGNLVVANIGIKWKYLLSPFMISGITTSLLGILAGYWLFSDNTQMKKCKYLLLAGVILILSGLLLSFLFPVIKDLWSSSFVLLAGGISSVMLSLFYWLIDIKNYKKWAFIFIVLGMNSITIYVLTFIVNFDNISLILVYGIRESLGVSFAVIISAISAILQWLFMFYLYKNKIFIKI
jgi:predicted acyltransferase